MGRTSEASAAEKELARIMNTYWANFAKTGNPNGKGVPPSRFTMLKRGDIRYYYGWKPAAKPDPRKAI